MVPDTVPPNVEVLPFQSDPREVYSRTKILLYARSREAGTGWLNGVGMAALEAACSGIPTVAYPGPGLRESLGDAGVWVESFEPEDWERAIRGLLDGGYAEASSRALARVAALDQAGDMDRFEAALRSALRRRRSPRRRR
jgi:glycosyltransferase involved in cell wall biosynthesis